MTQDNDVPWLHLLSRDYAKTAMELWLAVQESSMVDLRIDTKGIQLSLITATMKALCQQGKVLEEEVVRDHGKVPAWKLTKESLDIPRSKSTRLNSSH